MSRSKHQSHHRRQPWSKEAACAALSVTLAKACTSRLDDDQMTELSLFAHQAFEALQSNTAGANDINSLVNLHNITLLLCEAGLGPDRIPTCTAAGTALQAIYYRAVAPTGTAKWEATKEELSHILALITLHEDQLESPDLSTGMMTTQLCKLMQSINQQPKH